MTIRWKITVNYLVLFLAVLMVLGFFLLSTLYSYLFDQKKMEVLTSANVIASIISENFTDEYV